MASVFKRGGKRSKGYWYASWFDHNGKRQAKSTRTTDKATAERIAKKYEADAVNQMDAFASCTGEPLKATGTTDSVGAGRAAHAQQSGFDLMLDRAIRCEGPNGKGTTNAPTQEGRNLLQIATFGDSVRDLTRAEGTGLEPATGNPAPEFQSGR